MFCCGRILYCLSFLFNRQEKFEDDSSPSISPVVSSYNLRSRKHVTYSEFEDDVTESEGENTMSSSDE